MRWVTREHVHMDRVASPWLIKRFIDSEAEFEFISSGAAIPNDAIPFALPGVELGPHDATGSTFRKLLRKYSIKNAVLDMMAELIESGIAHYFAMNNGGKENQAHLQIKLPEGIGLEAMSRGMMFLVDGDRRVIEQSAVFYDSLYLYYRSKQIEAEETAIAELPFNQRMLLLRERLRADRGSTNPFSDVPSFRPSASR